MTREAREARPLLRVRKQNRLVARWLKQNGKDYCSDCWGKVAPGAARCAPCRAYRASRIDADQWSYEQGLIGWKPQELEHGTR